MEKETYDLRKIEELLHENPESADFWYKKGMALVSEKRYEECVIAFSTGLIYAPFHKGLRLQRGRKYTTLDDYRTATAELTLSTRLDPECQRQYEIVRKRRRNFVVFRRGCG